jgi:hypothetical protein
VRLNLGYIVILQGKTKQIMFNDSLAVDEDYPLLQNQIYLSPVLRFRNGFTVIPAFHYLNARFSTTRAAYDMGSNTYRFLSDTFNLNNYIGSLSVSKDISIFTAGLSGAVAYLNGNNHYQADAMLMVYPLGNLNLYAHSSFLMHFAEIPDDSNQQQGSGMQRNVLFTQMIGFKPFPGLWTEGSVSFGEVIEYFDKNSYIVYNLPEKILSKWGFQLYYQIHGHLMLGLKYDNLLREHYYITYLSAESNGRVYQPETVHYHYHQHILIGSLTWTL